MRITIRETAGDATPVIQKALDDVFEAGGGTVEIEKGVYPVSSLRVRSRTTLLLRSGAQLIASRDTETYDILEGDRLEPLHGDDLKKEEWVRAPKQDIASVWMRSPVSRWNRAILRVLYAENVRIVGEKGAVIEGSNPYDALGEEHYRGPHGISILDSVNVLCEGYTLQNTGNWAHVAYRSRNLTFRNVTVLAGHDGIHFRSCDNIAVEDCVCKTGDDCIAGFDNINVTVRNCELNTACSAFRFGGTNALVENCRIWAPGEYFFRGSLSLEDKISGTASPSFGRKNMLSLFTYFADFSAPVRLLPGNILFRNCTCEGADRVVTLDFSGNCRWQCNRPLASLAFENVRVSRARVPLYLCGGEEAPVRFSMTDCTLGFIGPVSQPIYAKNWREIALSRVTITGASGPLVKSWDKGGTLTCEEVSGVERGVTLTGEVWKFPGI